MLSCLTGSHPRRGDALRLTARQRVQANPDVSVDEKALVRAMGLVKGDIDVGMFFNRDTLKDISEAFKDESEEWFEKVKERERFATDTDAPFPSPPDLKDKVVIV